MSPGMVITRTPLRVSFVGGGSDRPEYYEEHGPGRVVSATITRYVYVTAHERAIESSVRVGYTSIEEVPNARDVTHGIIREALMVAGFRHGVEVHTLADIPGTGSGLGASSAVAVGALHALHKLRRREPSRFTLAHAACDLELSRLGQRIGRQDQWACAMGGVREYMFFTRGFVEHRRVRLSRTAQEALESHLFLAYTGERGEPAADVLARQTDMETIGHLAAMVPATCAALEAGDMRTLGRIVEENWLAKRALSPGVTTDDIDSAYLAARGEGAYGGKLCGAGGGGFLLMIVPPERRAAVRQVLRPMVHVDAGIDQKGSVVVHAH